MTGLKRWFPLTIAALFLLTPKCALALNTLDMDGGHIHFPDKAGSLADRVAAWYPGITAYLENQGLPVKKPIHIVLDQNLDHPGAVTQLYPLREIRLPMRAPGVFEDGYTIADPWRYYLFKGLCTLGIYNQRAGIPAAVHGLMGEVISPNLILPEWTIDGVSHLLYELYAKARISTPLAEAIFNTGAIPGLDRVSHHPEIWPGRYSYRIYGRPFARWLYRRYGWHKILAFLRQHGKGIIPIEIDLKARRAFGVTWNQLWWLFQIENTSTPVGKKGTPILGYWPAPRIHWNETGVYPGVLEPGIRSRYGYLGPDNWLWLSQYEKGVSRIKLHRRGTVRHVARDHVWDPGPGAVAVTRQGHTPMLVRFGTGKDAQLPVELKVAGPAGAIQMSGPVMDRQGRIAVAVNVAGNWDIWIYDQKWHRVTDAPSIETDPWFEDGKLIFASNVDGHFQIHGADMTRLTDTSTAALLPRGDDFLELDGAGWLRKTIRDPQRPLWKKSVAEGPQPAPEREPPPSKGKAYSPWNSLWPNYIAPDYFFNLDEFQLGLLTHASDVSRAFAWNAGARYDFDDEQVTWRLGARVHGVRSRLTRYPLRYTTRRDSPVDENRLEVNVSWRPQALKALTLAANWRRYTANRGIEVRDEDEWASIGWKQKGENLRGALHLDAFSDGSQSLYGDLRYRFGEKIYTVALIQGGKTWGDLIVGHNTFRIGGNAAEGSFTQRYTRLFPLRGFDSNIVEAGQAASASLNILWPFARLQSGYKTLPVFFHNITLNTFADAGFAAEHLNDDEIFISAGFELITGMQLAWDTKSSFSMGLAWPLRKPADIRQEGPVLLLLIGRPL